MKPLPAARRLVFAVAAGLASPGLVVAQPAAQPAWPVKPIRMIVPYPPGGPTDIMGRLTAEVLTRRLGETVVIDNRGGAATSIGAELAARAAPDGYTLFVSSETTFAVTPSLNPKLSWDPERDFTPISLLTTQPYVLGTGLSLPAASVARLIEYAKANPGKLSYGSAGVGSIGHLSGELLRSVTGSDMVHVPYKTSAAAYPDVIGGNVSMVFDTLPAAINHIKAGKVRPLAVLSPRRAALMPEVPTFAEAGVPEATLNFWSGLHAPANLPPALVARLSETLNKALNSPDLRERLLQLGADAFPVSQPAFVAQIKEDVARIAKVVKAAGIQPE